MSASCMRARRVYRVGGQPLVLGRTGGGSTASSGKPDPTAAGELSPCGAARWVAAGDAPESSASPQHDWPAPWPVLWLEGVVIPSRAR